MRAEFNAQPAQHQQPQNNHQRQVKPAEAGGIEQWKCKIKRSPGSQQPYFITIPDRADGAQHPAAFVVRLSRKKINSTRAEIESVQHDIRCDHHRHNPEPEASHYLASFPGCRLDTEFSPLTGPCSISRFIRNRNRIPSTVYIPMNPKRVNMPFPADTNVE